MNKIYPALKQVFSIWITSEEIYKYLNVQELASLCVVIESFAALPRDYLFRKYRNRSELEVFCYTLISLNKAESNELDSFCHTLITLIRVVKRLSMLSHR